MSKYCKAVNFKFTDCDRVDTVSHEENVPCGRPLGMAFDTIGDNIIVMHSYQGVFEVNLKSGKKKLLVSENNVIGVDVR